MAGASFRSLFEDAERHEDYWIERASVEVTEEVARRMDGLGVTRAELARRLGTSSAYVTKVLRGDVNFTLATMVKLSRALGCDLRVHLAPAGSGDCGGGRVGWRTAQEASSCRAPLERLRAGSRQARERKGSFVE